MEIIDFADSFSGKGGLQCQHRVAESDMGGWTPLLSSQQTLQ
jgi:hypothetical protein